MSSTSPVGTLAYIIDEEALLVRVNKGWQYIAVSTPSTFPLEQPIHILLTWSVVACIPTYVSSMCTNV